jgi:hypothetical protein
MIGNHLELYKTPSNYRLQPTPYSLRYAAASRRG